AVGGFGRREPAPYSDLDLVLLHDGRVDGLAELADAVWYPIWDAGVSLDHAVRTVPQALGVAKTDLKALLGMLFSRHIAGNPSLTARVRSGTLDLWRTGIRKRLPELQEMTRERWARSGDAAFLLEPNLKESRGGMRDAHALRALAAAHLVDVPMQVRATSAASCTGRLATPMTSCIRRTKTRSRLRSRCLPRNSATAPAARATCCCG